GLAKTLHGNQDHRYEITAEVVDQSRRTIVGTGQVLVSREPFKVFVWTDRGYYRVGDTIEASFRAQTLDQHAVAAEGTATLYRITYDKEGKPKETAEQTWKVATNDQGDALLKVKAVRGGQYRLACKLTDKGRRTIEGALILNVIGE